MAKIKVLAEKPPKRSGSVEIWLQAIREYLYRLVDELEYLLTNIGEDNLNASLRGLLNKVQSVSKTSAILKGDGAGGVSAAVAGTDYATPAQLEGKANQAQLAHVQTTNVADHTYKVGEPFCYSGYLFRTTTTVSSGTTLVNGQNCERVLVGAGLVSTGAVTATTTAQGRLSTGLQRTNAIVLAAIANNYFCSVYVNNDVQGVEVRDLSGAVVANTSVTVTLVLLYV